MGTVCFGKTCVQNVEKHTDYILSITSV